jgi:aspartyl-tRNA(Asn)/glutamyl-tRNA(Gln) amidotransferase subunit A
MTSPADKYFSAGLAAAVKRMGDTPQRVRTITEACLQYMQANDSVLQSMVHVDAESALAAADNLDASLAAGAAPLPLHGIPVVVKEIYSVAGMPDSSGSALPTPELFEPEGTLVQRLRKAGCVILGKSMSTEFALAHFNLERAMPVNPIGLANGDEPRATGGSSSGSAAAQAAGFCGFALGTDTGGSVRAPAALCGLVGFKPSEHLLPTDGIFPLSEQLDTPGFFCNSVADAETVFAAVSGADNRIGTEARDLAELRIGIPVGELCAGLSPEVDAAWHAALKLLQNHGVNLVQLDMPSLRAAEQHFAGGLLHELLQRLGVAHVTEHLDLLDPITRARLLPELASESQQAPADRLQLVRAEARKSLDSASVDCWLMPTVPCVACLQSELHNVETVLEWQKYASRNTRYTSVLGHAAISLPLPADISGQLPVGIQLAAPPGGDRELLQIAAASEAALSSGPTRA